MSTDPYRRVGIDRPGVAGLSSIGLGAPDAVAPRAVGAPIDPEELRSEARFALSLLAGSLGGVYVAAGLTLLGRLSTMGGALIVIGLLQGAWAAGTRLGCNRACAFGAVLNAMLILSWIASRTVGLSPGGGAPLPIGVLDTLCAIDAGLIVSLAATATHLTVARVVRLRPAPLSQLAILMAVLTVSALLGGHTHAAQAAGTGWGHGAQTHLYCRLL